MQRRLTLRKLKNKKAMDLSDHRLFSCARPGLLLGENTSGGAAKGGGGSAPHTSITKEKAAGSSPRRLSFVKTDAS
jgi:hypothetical protein